MEAHQAPDEFPEQEVNIERAPSPAHLPEHCSLNAESLSDPHESKEQAPLSERLIELMSSLKRSRPDLAASYASLFQLLEEEQQDSLFKHQAKFEALVTTLLSEDLEPEANLRIAHLFRELKSHFPQKQQSLEEKLFDRFQEEFTPPHERHCLSIALQDPDPATKRKLIQILGRENGLYASVALRGAIAEEDLPNLRRLSEHGSLTSQFAALHATFGSPPHVTIKVADGIVSPALIGQRDKILELANSLHVPYREELLPALRMIPLTQEVYETESFQQRNAVTFLGPDATSVSIHLEPLKEVQDVEIMNIQLSFGRFEVEGRIQSNDFGLAIWSLSSKIMSDLLEEQEESEEEIPLLEETSFSSDLVKLAQEATTRTSIVEKYRKPHFSVEKFVSEHLTHRISDVRELQAHIQEIKNPEMDYHSHLSIGCLIELLTDPTMTNATRWCAATLLKEIRCNSTENGNALEEDLLLILQHEMEARSKHFVALALQTPRRGDVAQELIAMMQRPEGIDAVVALRGSDKDIVKTALITGMRKGGELIRQRAVLASIGTPHREVFEVAEQLLEEIAESSTNNGEPIESGEEHRENNEVSKYASLSLLQEIHEIEECAHKGNIIRTLMSLPTDLRLFSEEDEFLSFIGNSSTDTQVCAFLPEGPEFPYSITLALPDFRYQYELTIDAPTEAFWTYSVIAEMLQRALLPPNFEEESS
jgi:hypothetical protein